MENMRKFEVYICSFFFIILCSCAVAEEKLANLEEVTRYSKHEISFSMPSNWKVTEDVGDNSSRYIFVESPGAAIVMVNTYRKVQAPALKEYVGIIGNRENKKFWLGLGSLSNGKISEFKSALDGREILAFKNEYTAKIFGVSTQHVIKTYSFESESYIAFVSFQSATEDLPLVSGGFNLVLSTFSWEKNP